MKRLMLIGLLAFTAPAWGQVTAEDVEAFETYTVLVGDTCTSIAKKFYGDVYAYDIIHAFNDLSATSYACTAGQVLQIPKLKPRPEAAVAQAVGPVKSAGPQSDWTDAERGTPLFRAWKVNTLEKARAELAFRDQSELAMGENTLVVIYGPKSADALARNVPRAEVERGTLKARLTQLSGGIDVDTPSANAQLEAGNKQISVDDEGTTRVENQSGETVRVEGRGKAAGKRVQVRAGFGTRVVREKGPERPRPLPPTPSWEDAAELYDVVIGEQTTTLKARWKPVKEAHRYYVELSRDRKGIDVFYAGFTPGDVFQVEVQNVPAGKYFAAVSAVDADLFESVPSAAKTFLVEGVRVSEGDWFGEVDGIPALWLGGQVIAPPGKKCGVETLGPRVELKIPGDFELKCEGQGKSASQSVRVLPPAIQDLPDEVVAIRGRVTTLSLTFEPARTRGLRVGAPVGVMTNALAGEGDQVLVQIVPSAEALDGPLTLTAYEVPFGEVQLKIQEPPVAEGDFGGPPIWTSVLLGFNEFGPSLDLRVGAITTPWFGGELRVAPGFSKAEETLTLEAGAHVMFGLLDTLLAPHVLAGLGVHYGYVEDVEPFLRLGGGLAWEPGEDWRIRLEVGVNLIADDDLRTAPFSALGVSFEW